MTSSASDWLSSTRSLIWLAAGRECSATRFKYRSIMSFGITVFLVLRRGFERSLRMLYSPVSNIEDKWRFWRPRAVIAVRIPLKDRRFSTGFHVESFTRNLLVVVVVSEASKARRIEKRRRRMRRRLRRRGRLSGAITFKSLPSEHQMPVLYPINSKLIRFHSKVTKEKICSCLSLSTSSATAGSRGLQLFVRWTCCSLYISASITLIFGF